jgi:predicted DNA-binding transcriptional regulator YafY
VPDVQLIFGRRLTTSTLLAQRLEVSESTVRHDVSDLQNQGLAIEGGAGVGSRLGRDLDVPPLMFSSDEARALVASVRMAQLWLHPALAQASQVTLGEILAVLYAGVCAVAQSLPLYASALVAPTGVQATLPASPLAPVAAAGLLFVGRGVELGRVA